MNSIRFPLTTHLGSFGWKSMLSSIVFVVCVLTICQCQPQQPTTLTLKGYTVLRAPFAEKDESVRVTTPGPFNPVANAEKLKGYFVDLLDEIAAISNFNYSLSYFSFTRGFYDKPESLLNEFQHLRADFIIADYLYIVERMADFSEPYQESGLSILIRKDRLEQLNIRNVDDLLNLRRAQNVDQSTIINNNNPNQNEEEISLGTVRLSNAYNQLIMAQNEVARKVYQRLYTSNNNLVDDREKGIQMALKEPYGFIQETMNNELAIDEHCELTQIPLTVGRGDNQQKDINLKYAVAFKKNIHAQYVEMFNKAIRQLKANGRLQELKAKYWSRQCNGSQSSVAGHLFVTILSLTISAFLLS